MARPRLSLASTLCGSLALALAGLLAWTGDAAPTYVSAQIATKVDFRRDIQPPDQWVSAAASNWAAMALTAAAPR